jgi:hypothetical protein
VSTKHPNALFLIEVLKSKSKLFVVLEVYPQNLTKMLVNEPDGHFGHQQACRHLKQLLDGLAQLPGTLSVTSLLCGCLAAFSFKLPAQRSKAEPLLLRLLGAEAGDALLHGFHHCNTTSCARAAIRSN